MELRPIKLLPAREHVASVLRDAILSKKFAQGHALTLDSIANMLGVSQTPVREAFQMLDREGLIRLTPNKGAVVREVSDQTIRERFEVRSVLECAVVTKICERGADLAEVERFHREIVHLPVSRRFDEYALFNLKFHTSIWDAAGNRSLAELLRQICSGLNLARAQPGNEEIQRTVDEHARIVDALIKRDARAACEAVRFHVDQSMNTQNKPPRIES